METAIVCKLEAEIEKGEERLSLGTARDRSYVLCFDCFACLGSLSFVSKEVVFP